MTDDTLDKRSDSLAELYADLLWNIDASSRIMLVKLPMMEGLASDPELRALLGRCFAIVNQRHTTFQIMLAHVGEPARVHAEELEALVGSASRRLSDWANGPTKDVAMATVVRTAIHMAIPACEVATHLAATLGYEAHVGTLEDLQTELAEIDAQFQSILLKQLQAQRPRPADWTRVGSTEINPNG